MEIMPEDNPTDLSKKLSGVPSSPGVYLMKDAEGKVIYVGKARNLKKRLGSYFSRDRHPDIKTGILIRKIATYETIITGTEQEALILESNLIKRHRPRYNVILKDDKRYPSLRLDIKARYPGLSIVRKPQKDGALYFGPFASPQAVYQTMRVINKTFRLRKCKTKGFKNRSRPCLNYQIGECLGPCCLDVDEDAYHEIVKEVILFLKGRTPDLIRKIRQDMMIAAEAQAYETAATLRDRLFALENILEKQISVTTDFKDRDVLGMVRTETFSLITILSVRGGHLLGSRHFHFMETLSSDSEMIGSFIRQYYEKQTPFVPKEILVPLLLEDSPLIEELLKRIKGEKVSILWPQKGEKARLVQMAVQNAEIGLKDLAASIASKTDMLLRLQRILKLGKIPERIECFDNSNISGSDPVAGMVAFDKGKPCKSLYRKYKIRTVTRPDDYAYMAEVLRRRCGKGEKSRPYPDLLMVDGGKGQLGIAVSIIKDIGLTGEFEMIGIAKKDEKKGETRDKIYKPGRSNPLNFGREADLLFFLQQVRDEAHRHAISFHRKRRGKTAIQSVLDTIPGIGKKRQQTLLTHFGSIGKIRAASTEDISALPGMNRKLAELVKRKLDA